ncbi:MAG TPA: hypothetical protein VK119_07490 [Bacillota bacterium]|nr:hypothetical protein [Bacillota bacterium]
MFKSVLLYTNQWKALKRFYQNVMELDVADSGADEFTVAVGETRVTFQQSDRAAFYHIAFNIPGNQFSIMKTWMKDRWTLNKEGGVNEVYFSSFDADSFYFEDPAGNIIELIGRRKRDFFGPLTKEAFFNVSEVGMVTPFVNEVGDQLQDFGIPLRHGSQVDPDSLNFLGTGDTYIVLVPPGRRWYFSDKVSETYPLEITLQDGRHMILDEKGRLTLFE